MHVSFVQELTRIILVMLEDPNPVTDRVRFNIHCVSHCQVVVYYTKTVYVYLSQSHRVTKYKY